MSGVVRGYNQQRGVGMVEVLIGALILAFVVTGTAVLMGDWLPTVNDSSNRTQAINRNVSVMEIARFNPNQATIVSTANTMQMSSPATTFTITGVSVQDNDGADTFSSQVVWTDPYLDADNKTRSFTLSSSVPDDDKYLGLADLVSNVPQITVSTNAGTGTVISPSAQDVLYGSSVAFEVNLQSGYYGLAVSGCNGSLAGNIYTTGTVVSNCTVSSTATLDTTDTDGDGVYDWQDVCEGIDDNSNECQVVTDYTVTPVAETGTTISPGTDPGSGTAARTFTLGLTTGYQNLSASGCNGSLSGNTYTTGTITANCTVTATATPISYGITTSAGTGSSISPTTQTVAYGATTSFTVSADSGYTISSVSGCGGSLSGSTYTTGTITGACQVSSVAEAVAQDWDATITVDQTHYGGGGDKYSVAITFTPGSISSCARNNSAGDYSCTRTTSESSITASISVSVGGGSGNTTICSGPTPSSVVLTSGSPSQTVALITAKNSSKCP
jgi:Tfp pilus assembly protein PilV